MSVAELPFPSSNEAASLASVAARPHEPLWLVWTRAVVLDALVRVKRPDNPSLDWLEELPKKSVPSITLSRLRSQPATSDSLEERRALVFLCENQAGRPLFVPFAATGALPRSATPLGPDGITRFLPALSEDAGHILIRPDAKDGALRPETVVWAVARWLPALISVGARCWLWPISCQSWSLTSSTPVSVPRDRVDLILPELISPPASEWASAWTARRKALGLSAPLASPYQLSATGPILPIRLPAISSVELKDAWLIAGSGRVRALARVIPLT